MPLPWSATVTDADHRRPQCNRHLAHGRRLAHRIAQQIDKDLNDCAGSPVAASDALRSVQALRSGCRPSTAEAIASSIRARDRRRQRPLAVTTHRPDDRQQMLGGGRNVARVGRIVRSQRAVGAVGNACAASMIRARGDRKA